MSRMLLAHRNAGVGRNQTNATNRAVSLPVNCARDTDHQVPRHIRNQASKFLARRNRESHEGLRRKTEWRFVQRPIEHRAKRHTGLLRGPPWFSLLLRVERLACLSLGPTSGTRYRRVSIGRHKRMCISQGTCSGSDLGGSTGVSVCYRRLSENSWRATAIWTVSSAAERG